MKKRIGYIPVCVKLIDGWHRGTLGVWSSEILYTRLECQDFAKDYHRGTFKFYPVYADIPKEYLK